MSETIGHRVRIRAIKWEGSARLLHGLTATVVAAHFIRGWVKIRLDPNAVTTELEWSIAVDRLEAVPESVKTPVF